MIQGGGLMPDGTQKQTNTPIKNEANNKLSNKRGTIAMARTGVIDSATSQFFINTVDNNMLDYKDDLNYGYAVFGEVISGMDTVDKISQVQTGQRPPFNDWPKSDVIIQSVKITNN